MRREHIASPRSPPVRGLSEDCGRRPGNQFGGGRSAQKGELEFKPMFNKKNIAKLLVFAMILTMLPVSAGADGGNSGSGSGNVPSESYTNSYVTVSDVKAHVGAKDYTLKSDTTAKDSSSYDNAYVFKKDAEGTNSSETTRTGRSVEFKVKTEGDKTILGVYIVEKDTDKVKEVYQFDKDTTASKPGQKTGDTEKTYSYAIQDDANSKKLEKELYILIKTQPKSANSETKATNDSENTDEFDSTYIKLVVPAMEDKSGSETPTAEKVYKITLDVNSNSVNVGGTTKLTVNIKSKNKPATDSSRTADADGYDVASDVTTTATLSFSGIGKLVEETETARQENAENVTVQITNGTGTVTLKGETAGSVSITATATVDNKSITSDAKTVTVNASQTGEDDKGEYAIIIDAGVKVAITQDATETTSLTNDGGEGTSETPYKIGKDSDVVYVNGDDTNTVYVKFTVSDKATGVYKLTNDTGGSNLLQNNSKDVSEDVSVTVGQVTTVKFRVDGTEGKQTFYEFKFKVEKRADTDTGHTVSIATDIEHGSLSVKEPTGWTGTVGGPYKFDKDVTVEVTAIPHTNYKLKDNSLVYKISPDATGTALEYDSEKEAYTFKMPDSDVTLFAEFVENTTTVSVTGVTLNKTETTLEEGQNEILTATVTPNNATDKSVYWTSSDAYVVSVDTDGKIKAEKEGSATVTVTTNDGGFTATCNVTVTKKSGGNVAVTGVTLNKTETTLEEGQSEILTATVTPENATDKSVYWTSSDAYIVSVDTDGKIKAEKEGSATVTVTTNDGGFTATCNVTVTKADEPGPGDIKVTGVSVDPPTLSLYVDDTAELKAIITPSDATNKTVYWTSNDTNIVEVEEATGKVTAKKAGKTTITVRTDDGNHTATCEITVSEKSTSKDGYTITADSELLNVKVGETITLSATVTYAISEDTTPESVTGGSVTWSAVPAEGVELTSETFDDGKASVAVTGLEKGGVAVTMTYTSEDGKTISYTFNVTVQDDGGENPPVVTELYSVAPDTAIVNGKIDVKKNASNPNDPYKFAKGDTVTFTVIPDENYKYVEGSAYTIPRDTDLSTGVKNEDGSYTFTFTMPGSNVTIKAVFELDLVIPTDPAELSWNSNPALLAQGELVLTNSNPKKKYFIQVTSGGASVAVCLDGSKDGSNLVLPCARGLTVQAWETEGYTMNEMGSAPPVGEPFVSGQSKGENRILQSNKNATRTSAIPLSAGSKNAVAREGNAELKWRSNPALLAQGELVLSKSDPEKKYFIQVTSGGASVAVCLDGSRDGSDLILPCARGLTVQAWETEGYTMNEMGSAPPVGEPFVSGK